MKWLKKKFKKLFKSKIEFLAFEMTGQINLDNNTNQLTFTVFTKDYKNKIGPFLVYNQFKMINVIFKEVKK